MRAKMVGSLLLALSGTLACSGSSSGDSGGSGATTRPPSGLTYSVNPATYTVEVAIPPNTPTCSGSAITSYSVSPALPAGLILNTSTGVISGTPSTPTDSRTYAVTATNSAGSTTASITVTVIEPVGVGFDFISGFTAADLALNGRAVLNGSRLRLTDGADWEASCAYFPGRVDIRTFTSDFTFQIQGSTGVLADGFAFVLQNVGLTALGPNGAGLGYGAKDPLSTGGIPLSVAVKFDLYNNVDEGTNSTGLYSRGASPTSPSVPITDVDLHAAHILAAHITYDGVTISVYITDTVTSLTFGTKFAADIPALVGSNTAYVGFTASSGTYTAVQEIIGWSYSNSIQP